MLFAVEGGGFFSASASGYSKGLTLLLLGHKDNKKPMRVIPWNQYSPVDQETKPDIQLDPGKTSPPLVRRCACFVCFGRDAAGDESPPTRNVEVELPQDQENTRSVDDVNGDSVISNIISLKSSLKRSADSPRDDVNGNGNGGVHELNSSSAISSSLKSSLKKSANTSRHDINGSGSVHEVKSDEDGAVPENGNEITCQTQRRVQWTDTIGGELSEIREFEMSEDSEDEFDDTTKKTCSCRIM